MVGRLATTQDRDDDDNNNADDSVGDVMVFTRGERCYSGPERSARVACVALPLLLHILLLLLLLLLLFLLLCICLQCISLSLSVCLSFLPCAHFLVNLQRLIFTPRC